MAGKAGEAFGGHAGDLGEAGGDDKRGKGKEEGASGGLRAGALNNPVLGWGWPVGSLGRYL